jgi:hypothetical protein
MTLLYNKHIKNRPQKNVGWTREKISPFMWALGLLGEI